MTARSDPSASSPDLVGRVHALLRESGATVACAESLTGGLLCAELVSVGGASVVFRGGLVSYASEAKVDVLGVDSTVVETYGVISRQCAQAMAARARKLFHATYGLATTGVAGPDRQEDKPVGTVHVAVAGPSGFAGTELRLPGDRSAIRAATVTAALELLASTLTRRVSDPPGAPG